MATTIPGGYYIGTDGKPHDAHGNPLPLPPAAEPPVADGVAVEHPVKPKAAKVGRQ